MNRLKIEDFIRKRLSDRTVFRLNMLRSRIAGEKEIRFLTDLVDNSRNCIDVGANRGIYTHHLSKLSQHVTAYEPNPRLAEFLLATAGDNVSVIEMALSDKVGDRTLSIPVSHGHVTHNLARLAEPGSTEPGTRTYEVKVSTLDTENHDNVGFIKIDVEGHELRVLKGAESLLAKCRPNLLVEIEQRHQAAPVQETINHILSLGYRGFFVDKNTLLDVSGFSVDTHQNACLSADKSKILSSNYVNNFIFKPAGEITARRA